MHRRPARPPAARTAPPLTLRIPLATYRLQFNAGFTFQQAEALVPYLRRLGVGDLYASPVFKARPGSAHGYDILDYGELNPELGGAPAFQRLAAALRRHDMGLILDIVPNHLCVAHEGNQWWNDVLRHGQASRFARMFDIDWNPPQAPLRDRLVLPILLAPLEQALRRGEITVALTGDEFWLRYRDRNLPTDPGSWPILLDPLLRKEGGAAPAAAETLRGVTARLHTLPSRDDGHPDTIRSRHRTAEACQALLGGLLEEDGRLQDALAGVLREANAGAADPAGLLHRFLAAQVYLPMYWPDGLDVLNYRRYADVSDLAGVRQEHPDVFLATHELVLDLIGDGAVTGLRVDHPDGLLDPRGYFVRLQRGCALMQGALKEGGRGITGALARSERGFYVLAEKILSGEEPLRPDWPVFGTTGYEVLHLVNGLFVDPAGERPLREVYARFTGRTEDFHTVLLQSKRTVLAALLRGEHARLTQRLADILRGIPEAAHLAREALHRAVGEVLAAFPVYTHYLRRMGPPPESEAAFVQYAVTHARQANPDLPPEAFTWIQSLLLLEGVDPQDGATFMARQEFALRFRQMLSAVMGKGLEDTALYRYVPLASLNEMGGDPAEFVTPLAVFHRRMAERQSQWPHGLSTTSTHDTKRSEDVRARLNVLSEIPAAWEEAQARWWVWHQPLRREVGGRLAPDANEACLFYQSLLGAWPMEFGAVEGDFSQRLRRFMRKALREAKLNSNWIEPNLPYEGAVLDFVTTVLRPEEGSPFLADAARFHGRIALAGACNSLAQVVLKITAPGVPDLYQGCDLWDLSLVDPDNRRPVDFERRRAYLDEIEEAVLRGDAGLVRRLWDGWRDGRIKLFVTRQALHFRREWRAVYEQGSYRPLTVAGERAQHAVAFARQLEGRMAITVVGRRFTALGVPERLPLGEAWGETRLMLDGTPAGEFRDVFTGRIVTARFAPEGSVLSLAAVFAQLPVALLEYTR